MRSVQPVRILQRVYGATIHLVPSGYSGRLPTLWDANLTLSLSDPLGPVTVTLQAYLFNVFNNQIRTARTRTGRDQQQVGYPNTIYDPNQPSTNPHYGRITDRSEARLFRAAVRISFLTDTP